MSSNVSGDAVLFACLVDAARARNEAALALLKEQTSLDPERVHGLRVAVKQLRALWRLAATQGHRKTADKRDRALRDAARGLSVARDRQVMGETLDRLRAASHRDYEQQAVDTVRQALPAEAAALAPAKPADLDAVFQNDRACWDALTFDDDQDLIKKGLGRLYADARQRGLEAISEDRPEAWHDFRKYAKYQLYQLEPLADRLGNGDIALKDLRKLGRQLGEMHDLQVLDDFLRQARKQADDKEPFAHVRQMISRHESALIDDCEKRTRRFFGPKPKAFRKALRQALGEAGAD